MLKHLSLIFILLSLIFVIQTIGAQAPGIFIKDPECSYGKVQKSHNFVIGDMNMPELKLPDRVILWRQDTMYVRYYLFNKLYINRYVFESGHDQITSDSPLIYQEVSMDCSKCSDKYLKYYTSRRKSGFRFMGNNSYLSSYKKKTRMIINQDEGKETCMTFIFFREKLDKKSYKKLYRSLR